MRARRWVGRYLGKFRVTPHEWEGQATRQRPGRETTSADMNERNLNLSHGIAQAASNYFRGCTARAINGPEALQVLFATILPRRF